MLEKLVSKKSIVLIGFPMLALFLQGFTRFVLKVDFNTIGITLGALGLGQLLPFMHFDHFVSNKLLGTRPEYTWDGTKFNITYDVKPGTSLASKDIEHTKNLFMWAVLVSLCLFLVILYLGIKNYIFWHILFGSLICLVAWYLLIFRND